MNLFTKQKETHRYRRRKKKKAMVTKGESGERNKLEILD